MNDIVKEYITSGKDLREILKDRIKSNDRKWIFTFVLFSIIWIGYVSIVNSRNIELTKELNIAIDSIKYQNVIIDCQFKALDTAVYFQDIK